MRLPRPPRAPSTAVPRRDDGSTTPPHTVDGVPTMGAAAALRPPAGNQGHQVTPTPRATTPATAPTTMPSPSALSVDLPPAPGHAFPRSVHDAASTAGTEHQVVALAAETSIGLGPEALLTIPPVPIAPRFHMPVIACLGALIGMIGLVSLPWVGGAATTPYGDAPVWAKATLGAAFFALGALTLLAMIGDLSLTRWLVAVWAFLGTIGTAYARSSSVSASTWILASLLALFCWGIVGINNAWRGIWSSSRRNALNLTVLWAAFGIILISGQALPEATRQAAALGVAGLFLTPWGACVAGWGLRKIADTTRTRLDSSKVAFALASAALGAAVIWHRGPIPHLEVAGMALSLHDLARWLLCAGLALYTARHPQLQRPELVRLGTALVIAALLFIALGERFSLVLLVCVAAAIGATVWGVRRVALPLLILGFAGVGIAFILNACGAELALSRLSETIMPRNPELSRARFALITAGWTGLGGIHVERLSAQSVTDYAISTIALNYGRLGLILVLAITALQICLLFVASARITDLPCRLLALTSAANIGIQALLPLLAMAGWAPYGGIPWCLAARGIASLLLQTLASAGILGAISVRKVEETSHAAA